MQRTQRFMAHRFIVQHTLRPAWFIPAAHLLGQNVCRTTGHRCCHLNGPLCPPFVAQFYASELFHRPPLNPVHFPDPIPIPLGRFYPRKMWVLVRALAMGSLTLPTLSSPRLGRICRAFQVLEIWLPGLAFVPGNNESAGKRYSGRIRKGSPHLRQAIIEAAHGATRTKTTYLAAQYRHIAARRGPRRALVAVAHSLLTIIYYVLMRHEPYRELGGNYFDEHDRRAVEHRLVGRLRKLGFNITLQTVAQPA
jgi:hypothetical protein